MTQIENGGTRSYGEYLEKTNPGNVLVSLTLDEAETLEKIKQTTLWARILANVKSERVTEQRLKDYVQELGEGLNLTSLVPKKEKD